MEREKVLVTGATGFLGNHIVRVLLSKNYDVVVMLRSGSDIRILAGLECKILRGDLTNLQEMDAAVKGCQFVIHSAALTAQNVTDFEVYRKANVLPAKTLVAACQKNNIRRFVYVSTANSFTPGSLENPGDENSGFMSRFRDAGYAYSKYLAQEFILKKARQENFPAVVVAPTFMVGPIDPKPSSGALLLYVLNNRITFYPKGGKSFVDVRAVATATVNGLKMGREGESYILSGVNLTYKDFYRRVSLFSKRKSRFVPLPGSTGKVLGVLSFLFPFKKLKLLKTNINNLFINNYFTNRKAKQELAMSSTELDPLLQETISWFKEHGYIKK